jgi:hypothetical protein
VARLTSSRCAREVWGIHCATSIILAPAISHRIIVRPLTLFTLPNCKAFSDRFMLQHDACKIKSGLVRGKALSHLQICLTKNTSLAPSTSCIGHSAFARDDVQNMSLLKPRV